MRRIIQSLSKQIFKGDIVTIMHNGNFQYQVETVTKDAVTVGAMRMYPHATIGFMKSCVRKSRCLTFKNEVRLWWSGLNKTQTNDLRSQQV